MHTHCWRVSGRNLLSLALLFPLLAHAETFVGTNAPGQSTAFSFALGTGTTNLALYLTNTSSGFSHLLLKKNGVPTDTDYDFVAQVDGRDNAINLEVPELAAASYGLRVRTPLSSQPNNFVVSLRTNVDGLRSAGLPAMKSQATALTGSLAAGQWHYFRVEIPTNSPGWRLVLNSEGTGIPALYI
ncbi:MAG TPA: hypothetical protein VNT26_11390, partial [Candidatus Sulfotelmatobacter sp.]|nr:hypothetical protein [Candidatus Sulfotelmatobacter sp.]